MHHDTSLTQNNLTQVNKVLGNADHNVQLLAVSKGQNIDKIMVTYGLGIRNFGENYLQEAIPKIATIPQDAIWHFIGKIQKNKLKLITKYFHWIESVTDLTIAKKINSYSKEFNKHTNLLLQLSHSSSRDGFKEEEIIDAATELNSLNFIHIKGIMVMPEPNLAIDDLENQFTNAYNIYIKLKKIPSVTCLSMGMSSDFLTAVNHGSNQVRLGTILYGARVK